MGLCWDGAGQAGRGQGQVGASSRAESGEGRDRGSPASASPAPSGEPTGDTLDPGALTRLPTPGFPGSTAASVRPVRKVGAGPGRPAEMVPGSPGSSPGALGSRLPPLAVLSGNTGLPCCGVQRVRVSASLPCKNQRLAQSSEKRPITSIRSGFSQYTLWFPPFLLFCLFVSFSFPPPEDTGRLSPAPPPPVHSERHY